MNTAAREVVDTFDFSALASVRPTIALFRTLRCLERLVIYSRRSTIALQHS